MRATTPDRMPLAGQVAPGLFVLGGLGSRGFTAAPLLAEHIAALALARPRRGREALLTLTIGARPLRRPRRAAWLGCGARRRYSLPPGAREWFRSETSMKILASTALAIAAAMAVGASAQPPGGAPPPPAPKPRPACFWTSRIQNFAAVDERNLYLRVGNRDIYRAKLFSNCIDISWVHRLALVSRSSSLICEGPNLDVDVVLREVGAGRQRCPVTEIRKLTPDEVAALPKLARPCAIPERRSRLSVHGTEWRRESLLGSLCAGSESPPSQRRRGRRPFVLAGDRAAFPCRLWPRRIAARRPPWRAVGRPS